MTMNLLAQAPGMVWSLWVMASVPLQLSVATTAPWLAAGTALAHGTVTSAGMLASVGGAVSVTWAAVAQALGQPLASVTVNRKVAVAEKTWAVVVKEAVSSMVAVPVSTLQSVEAISWRPAVAWPCKGKEVESPSVHRV